MSIADKLVTIAENVEKVYEAGKRAGSGGESAFWSAYLENGNRASYTYAFYNWPDATFYPTHNIAPSDVDNTTAANMFAYCKVADLKKRLEDCGVTLDLSNCIRLANTFYRCDSSALPVIDMSSCTSTSSTFYDMKKLTSLHITGLRADCTFSSTFNGCSSLETLEIEGIIGQTGFSVAACPLTKASLENIIDCLEEKTSGTWTITLGSKNLTTLGYAKGTVLKGWTLA